jgi:hypothetical protein
MPIFVTNYPRTLGESALAEIQFIDGDATLQDNIGLEAWGNLHKGLASHPLFSHLTLHGAVAASKCGNIAKLMRKIANGEDNKAGMESLQYACIHQAMASISAPISNRYPRANGIDGKARKAAGLEYMKDASLLQELLVSNDSDIAKALGGSLGKAAKRSNIKGLCEKAIAGCVPALPAAAPAMPAKASGVTGATSAQNVGLTWIAKALPESPVPAKTTTRIPLLLRPRNKLLMLLL